jgi:hypothetical protein
MDWLTGTRIGQRMGSPSRPTGQTPDSAFLLSVPVEHLSSIAQVQKIEGMFDAQEKREMRMVSGTPKLRIFGQRQPSQQARMERLKTGRTIEWFICYIRSISSYPFLLFLGLCPIQCICSPLVSSNEYSSMINSYNDCVGNLNGSISLSEFIASQQAFLEYLDYQNKSLEILNKPIRQSYKACHSYKYFINSLLEDRTKELVSIRDNNASWYHQPSESDHSALYSYLRRKLSYDRPESFRSSYRKSEEAWNAFMQKDFDFYKKYLNNESHAEKYRKLLYEKHIELLSNEYYEIKKLKLEKEE